MSTWPFWAAMNKGVTLSDDVARSTDARASRDNDLLPT
jgi:hypothetical protein